MFAGSIVKPGFNPLATQTPSYLYNILTWGGNNFGQLGIGNTIYYSSPKQVGSLTTWLSISSNYASVLAIKTNGTLWSWGRNGLGQCGYGNTTYYSSPKQVGALTNWAVANTGTNHSLAIKTDGTLWGWGYNRFGQLGLGNITYYSSPKQIGALTAWASVQGKANMTVAIKTDGTLWTWGQNSFGNLGNGNTTSYSSPIQVGSLTTWSKIATGAYGTGYCMVIKTDGTLWSWGRNLFGELGQNQNGSYSGYKCSSPVQVTGSGSSWVQSAASFEGYTTFAIKT